MRCGECGTENRSGIEFCAECGKTLAIALEAHSSDSGQAAAAEASLGFIAPTGFSLDGDAVCHLCGRTCSGDDLQRVEGTVFCPECVPFMKAGEDATAGFSSGVRPPTTSAPSPLKPVEETFRAPSEPTAFGKPDVSYGGSSGSPTFASPMGGLPSDRPIFLEKPARRFPLPTVVLLLLLGVGGYLFWHFFIGRDRIDRLLAEAESSDRSVSLVPSLEQGQTWRYLAEASVDLEMTGAINGETLDINAKIDLDLDFYLDVLALSDTGTATLQVAIESVTVSADMDGNVPGMGQMDFSKKLEEFEGETYELQLDRRGRLSGGDEDLGKLTGILMMSEDVPDHPIRVGETWTQSVPLPRPDMPGADATELTMTCRLVGFAKHLGHDCAVIEVDGGAEIADKTSAVEIEFKGAMFMDANDGHLVHVAVDMHLEFAASAGMLGSLSMDVTLSMDVKQQ